MTTQSAQFTYDQILTTGMDDINVFPSFIVEIAGIEQGSYDYNIITTAIQTKQDLAKFGKTCFDGNPDNMVINTLNYLAVH